MAMATETHANLSGARGRLQSSAVGTHCRQPIPLASQYYIWPETAGTLGGIFE